MSRFVLPFLLFGLWQIACNGFINLSSSYPVRQLNNSPDGMNNNRINDILSTTVEELDGKEGFWKFKYQDVPMIVITDEKSNRFRIISAITDVNDLNSESILTLMEANFDRTMDARYAVYKGKLYSAFISPLSNLTTRELRSALDQVANLVINYGTTYSSSDLRYQGEY
ncbi:MAG: hypothetical protein ACE5H1_10035 [Thermodesulfobacteriota bacterium]